MYGRQLIVQRVVRLGYSPALVAEQLGVSRSCVYGWVRRWRAEGEAGLHDRSSRPHASPRRLAADVEQRILAARAASNDGPHQLSYRLGIPRSTIYAVLRRHGVSRLATCDQPTGQPVRYAREHPGELLHVDVKKLGRIPDGGGWRVHGRGNEPRKRDHTVGYDYLHVAVDDATRVAYIEIHRDETGATCARFLQRSAAWFAGHGVKVAEIMTDNAKAYTVSRLFRAVLDDLGVKHVRIRPRRPQTNGKVERLNQTLAREWAYSQPYTSNDQRSEALGHWLHWYNHHRPHTAHQGASPMQVLDNHVPGNHT